MIFRLRGPDGSAVVDHVVEVDRDQQRWLGFAGAPRPGAGWPAGTYAGDVTLERSAAEGPLSVTLERSIQLFEP